MVVEQRFDQAQFGRTGAVKVQTQQQALTVDEQHQLAAFPMDQRFPPLIIEYDCRGKREQRTFTDGFKS